MQTFNHISHGTVKMGLLRPARFKGLALSNYCAPAALPFPPVRAWERPLEWGMLGNDKAGDCVIAWMLHQIMAWKAVADAGSPAYFAVSQAIQSYSDITGYKPSDPSTDNGTDPNAALAYWKSNGLWGHKIAGSVDLDVSNLDMLKGALNIFGGIGLSIQVPAYVMDVTAGGSWSDKGGDKSIIGEHQVLGIGYGRKGFRLVSWGTTYTCDFDFLSESLMASQAVVSADWIKRSGQSPSGLDIASLLADLESEA